MVLGESMHFTDRVPLPKEALHLHIEEPGEFLNSGSHTLRGFLGAPTTDKPRGADVDSRNAGVEEAGNIHGEFETTPGGRAVGHGDKDPAVRVRSPSQEDGSLGHVQQ